MDDKSVMFSHGTKNDSVTLLKAHAYEKMCLTLVSIALRGHITHKFAARAVSILSHVLTPNLR